MAARAASRYQAAPEWTGDVLRGMLAATDAALGGVLQALKAKSMWDHSVIFYCADNVRAPPAPSVFSGCLAEPLRRHGCCGGLAGRHRSRVELAATRGQALELCVGWSLRAGFSSLQLGFSQRDDSMVLLRLPSPSAPRKAAPGALTKRRRAPPQGKAACAQRRFYPVA